MKRPSLLARIRAEREERRLHNDEDPACRFWWGDRSGMDLHARCSVCSPLEFTEAPANDEVAVPAEVPWEEAREYARLDVRGHDWIYFAPGPNHAVVSSPRSPRLEQFLQEALELAYSVEANLVSGSQFPNVIVPAATRLVEQLRAALPSELVNSSHVEDDEEPTEIVATPVEMPAGGTLRAQLATLLNSASAENGSDTPDHILAEHLAASLEVFDRTTRARDKWWGFRPWDKVGGTPQ